MRYYGANATAAGFAGNSRECPISGGRRWSG
jgi:hypothetical protein